MKTAVVTGASRGIGRATALRFLSAGYRVVGTSTTGDVGIDHDRFEALRIDMADGTTIEQALRRLDGSTIDVLVNNAGVVLDDRSDPNISMKILRKAFEINVFGLVEFCEGNLGRMAPGGHIVSISSNWGTFSDHNFEPLCPHYKMTKAALNMYTKLLAARLDESGIRVSAIDPGWVRTDLGGPSAPVTAEEAAEAIFQLATGDAPTGHLWRDGQIRGW